MEGAEERLLEIATGASAKATKWRNQLMSWGELCERLQSPLRTAENTAEYKRMSPAEKAKAKDHGGFVGGFLRNGQRKRQNVSLRSVLTLDADKAEPDFFEKLQRLDYRALAYTTHGHCPESPRVRVIIPLKANMGPEPFAALSRYCAAELGIEQFDPCSYYPHQLMYWPSCPSDGAYRVEQNRKDWLDGYAYLDAHPEWKDSAMLPRSVSEPGPGRVSGAKQEDPTQKEGWVGTFCRRYGISDAIEAFLSEVYYPTDDPARWGLKGSESTPGLVLYDNDLFAYSQHATDPACGQELNAFDLVRVHKFGEDSAEDSFRKMVDFAAHDKGCKAQWAKERAEAVKDFDGVDSGEEDRDWMMGIEFNKAGAIIQSLANFQVILGNDPALAAIGYDAFEGRISARGEVPWTRIKPGWGDADDAGLAIYLAEKYKGLYSPEKMRTALMATAVKHCFHPVREWLEGLPAWDGLERIDRLWVDWLGAEDSAYTRATARKLMVAAVARVMEPGVKFDCVPILVGPQGIGKSTLFNRLGGAWFSDSLTLNDMRDKSGAEKLQGYWILELGELAGMRKAEVETVKSFITTQDDKFRASYGKVVESHPRQCVIVGSTNSETGFLRDVTGNRRFWPINVSGGAVLSPWDLDAETVRQMWAEALSVYREGKEELYLTGEAAAQALAVQSSAMETDDREGLVRAFLDTSVPADWMTRDLSERLNWWRSPEDARERGTMHRNYVCNLEIWCECFLRDGALMRKQDSYEIAAIMSRMDGWTNTGKRMRWQFYGLQRVYQRQKQAQEE